MIARYLIVGMGGFCGAIARYAVGVWCDAFWRRDFPLATFLVNVSGCFILGFFLTLAAERLPFDPRWRLFVATGFVGAYTTFSTFEYETQRLTTTGALGWAVVNVLTSVIAGYLAVKLGVALARR
jgi:CrcB protein